MTIKVTETVEEKELEMRGREKSNFCSALWSVYSNKISDSGFCSI